MNSKQGISRRAAAPSTKSVRPSEGIFYLIRLPRGWRVQPVCAGDFPGEDFGHADFWVRLLADLLAKEWQPKVCEKFRTVATLRAGLLPLVYAFPRGRVVRQGRKFAV